MQSLRLAVLILWLSAGIVSTTQLLGLPESCVCVELSGPVRDCCCDFDTVEQINRQVHPHLAELLETTFFKYFKVNLQSACPFWADDSQCMLRDCSVEECTEQEVPEIWRDRDISDVDFGNQGFPLIRNCHTSDKDFCVREGDAAPECTYVDLKRNPEAYTGYGGPSAHRVWNSIYQENCFKPDVGGLSNESYNCTEKRMFYRLISGLQSSIAAHLSSRYYNRELQIWTHNDTLFSQRLGAHADRLENLYFVYNVVFRSIRKIANYIIAYDLSTGNLAEDAQVENLVKSLVSATSQCPETFDESTVFTSPKAYIIKEQFKSHFRNISRIMDCVGCEKCRLWGKLQIQGLGTALKILFSYDDVPHGQTLDYQLKRNEVVALFNLMGRLSESLIELEAFRSRTRTKLVHTKPFEASSLNLLKTDSGLFFQLMPQVVAVLLVFLSVMYTWRCTKPSQSRS